MRTVKLIPKFCYPISYQVDYDQLYTSINILLGRLGLDMEEINKRCTTEFAFTVNLTHKPELTGRDRWAKYSGSHADVAVQGVEEVSFDTHLDEIKDLYLGEVLQNVYNQHEGVFQGRAQLIWLGAHQKYVMHRDPHTPDRYHIPIITNVLCNWVFGIKQDTELVTLHMPADGRVWYLNPVALKHTFVNDSNIARLHLLLTSGI